MPNYLLTPSESVRSLLIGVAAGTIVNETYPNFADKGTIFDGFSIMVQNYGDATARFRVEIWDMTTPIWTQVAQSNEFNMDPSEIHLCIFGNAPEVEVPYDGPAWIFNPGGGGDGAYSFELKQNVGGTWVPDAILEKIILINTYIMTEMVDTGFLDASNNPITKINTGTVFSLVGTLRRIESQLGISGKEIKIDYREATFIRPPWQTLATVTTDADGFFSSTLTSPSPSGAGPWTFEYRASFAGGAGLSASSISVGMGVSGLVVDGGRVVLAVTLPVIGGILALSALNWGGK